MMRIFLVRHGETQGNVEGVYYGHTDLPLTDNGKQQSMAVASYLSNVDFSDVLTSYFIRAEETARFITNGNKVNFQRDNRLNEMYFGQWEMCHFNEIAQNYPDDWSVWVNDWENACPTGGEPFSEFASRVFQFADELKGRRCSKNLLIVAHQGVLSLMMARLLAMPVKAMWHFPFSQGAYSVLDNQDGFISLNMFNHQSRFQ